MNRTLNYLGQLRVYSLVDFMLLLIAAGASPATLQFWGAVLMWVGFLAYLESVHHDQGREPVPDLSGWLLMILGLMWWKNSVTGYVFVACSVCYAHKKQRPWALVSPLLRGAQTFVIVGAICGLNHGFPWFTALLMATRNLLGDVRDSQEDTLEGTYTWPVKLRMESRPFAHLLGIFGTTTVWWLYAASLPGWLLVVVLMIEAATYYLTPRSSNKYALARAQKILRKFRR